MHHASRSAPWKKRNSARLSGVVAADVVGEVERLVGRHHQRRHVEEDDRQRPREIDAQRRGVRQRVVDGSAGRARLDFQHPWASATGSFTRTLTSPQTIGWHQCENRTGTDIAASRPRVVPSCTCDERVWPYAPITIKSVFRSAARDSIALTTSSSLVSMLTSAKTSCLTSH